MKSLVMVEQEEQEEEQEEEEQEEEEEEEEGNWPLHLFSGRREPPLLRMAE